MTRRVPENARLRRARPAARCGIRARALAAGHFNQRVSRRRDRVSGTVYPVMACGLCRHAVSRDSKMRRPP
jgi:hypothetical protein